MRVEAILAEANGSEIRSAVHNHRHPRTLWQRHGLSLVTGCFLVFFISMYSRSDPSKHWGSFFGNAIADWSGAFVMMLATKFLYERGSAESRRPPKDMLSPWLERVRDHSLSIFLLITGLGWVWIFVAMNSESKWGQVVGNIVSEWTQVFMLVLLTKKLIEWHSKEDR
jgi:hypothetical protein